MSSEENEVIKVKAAISLTWVLAFLVQLAAFVYFFATEKSDMKKDIGSLQNQVKELQALHPRTFN